MSKFPFYKQLDGMDCGPSCLRMIAKYYGKTFSVQQLREQSYIQRTGVNLLGISEAAASIGLRATGIRTSMEKLKQQSKLPCIIHWNQEHFVVLYKIEKKRGKTWFYIADPAYGLLKYEEQELKKCWISTTQGGIEKGIALLLDVTPQFYEAEPIKYEKLSLWYLFHYVRPYKKAMIQLTTDDSLVDIVQQGFDAGVRLSGIVEKDMISVAIGPPVKLCVAATPEYFARYGKPRHPHDLLNHQCVVFRYPSGKPFHWQFAKELEIAVAGNIILDDVDAELEAVLMGAGIGYLLYEQIKEYLDTGRLECVLEDWSTERPGFQIYYPNRQYMSCGLRAFLDYVKTGQICQSQRHRPQ